MVLLWPVKLFFFLTGAPFISLINGPRTREGKIESRSSLEFGLYIYIFIVYRIIVCAKGKGGQGNDMYRYVASKCDYKSTISSYANYLWCIWTIPIVIDMTNVKCEMWARMHVAHHIYLLLLNEWEIINQSMRQMIEHLKLVGE